MAENLRQMEDRTMRESGKLGVPDVQPNNPKFRPINWAELLAQHGKVTGEGASIEEIEARNRAGVAPASPGAILRNVGGSSAAAATAGGVLGTIGRGFDVVLRLAKYAVIIYVLFLAAKVVGLVQILSGRKAASAT